MRQYSCVHPDIYNVPGCTEKYETNAEHKPYVLRSFHISPIFLMISVRPIIIIIVIII